MNEPEQIQRALEYTSRKIGKPNIYTMISGRLTPKQHDIAKRRCTINSADYTTLLHWFQQNHPSYSQMQIEETNPQPVNICGLEQTQNTTDKITNNNTETGEDELSANHFVFSPTVKPHQKTGIYKDEKDFVASILNDKEPTLLFRGGILCHNTM